MTLALTLLIAALSGFIALSYEMLWYRVIAFESWGTPGAFGLLLAAYLLGLAIGSRIAGRFCKDDARAGDRRQLRLIAGFTLVANVVAWAVVPIFGLVAKTGGDWPAAIVFVAIAAALLGAILPLLSHFGIASDDHAGQRLSYVYLANIVGSAAGSLVTGFVFFDVWTLQTTATALGLTGFALVTLLVALSDLRGAARAKWLGASVLAGAIVFLATPVAYARIWERLLFKEELGPDSKFSEIIETRSGVITVTKNGAVYGGGAYDGIFNTSLIDDRNTIVRAYAVAALHPAPRRVMMIGLASGSWAAVIAQLPGVEHFTIVEINSGYTTLIARHPEVSGILRDPKVEIVIDDGRRWLNRHPEQRFDVIVMNTTWHWRAHATGLLSAEFMNLARSRLAPGGIFYFNATRSLDVEKTTATVFPHALRFLQMMVGSDSPLVFDRERWNKTLETVMIDGRLAIDRSTPKGEARFRELSRLAGTIDANPPEVEGLEKRADVLTRTRAATVVTDDNMVPEWRTVLRLQDPPHY